MFHHLKKFIPASWLRAYHYFLARLAAVWYGHPSRRLIVIGVTGTNGKTTTAYLIAKALESSETKTGCTTSAIFKIGEREWLNDTKMTMPGRFFLQKMLRQMVDAGCRYAVIETSSQGLIQSRHIGIKYDIGVFTNLTPEHLEAHGGFENYKRAKRILFESVPTAVINADSPYGTYYAQTPGLKRIVWFGVEALSVKDIKLSEHGSTFRVQNVEVSLSLPGRYNVENALAALATSVACGIDFTQAAARLASVKQIPGRMERVNEGQPWTVIVDYAPEPESLRQMYQALTLIPHARIIHVLGSCGGGRDQLRRPILGQLAAQNADVVIVTNEDPYDEDPEKIIDQVLEGAVAAGKILGQTAYRIIDRRQAIFKAMELAESNDLVVMTGKGSETWICGPHGSKTPWDEREVAREGIRKRMSNV
ncbi:MAG: UDP-N-acetylmuramoyl-L-alanyl-D-glutamate--2,6-diaminopimelate ligase [Candidatus Uhrbacteria bacterium]|nr:UDP-N-acetylmuramoyl-L-alanyl-D-glutamate--2,6-diaminopimelate ligase [Candidatus Uhrbacteria bacterium]MDP3793583.1 UDP-N-acetylmuramoyl-L-alanyl-D-glutamate--2,6-diaminopimelate ligase [Candidatus Uhrbacteria bacterium]